MIRAATLALLALTLPASAQSRFDGAWTSRDASSCNPASDSVIRIQGEQLRYWESGCQLGNPVAVRDLDATLYDADCSGEGETWRTRLMLALTPEGQLLHLNQYGAMMLTACPMGGTAPAAPGK